MLNNDVKISRKKEIIFNGKQIGHLDGYRWKDYDDRYYANFQIIIIHDNKRFVLDSNQSYYADLRKFTKDYLMLYSIDEFLSMFDFKETHEKPSY